MLKMQSMMDDVSREAVAAQFCWWLHFYLSVKICKLSQRSQKLVKTIAGLGAPFSDFLLVLTWLLTQTQHFLLCVMLQKLSL